MSARIMRGEYRVFVLIGATPGEDSAVLEELLQYDEVIEVHRISGQYDLLAVLRINLHGKAIFTSVQDLAHKAVEKIRDLSGVRETNTIVPFFSVTKQAK